MSHFWKLMHHPPSFSSVKGDTAVGRIARQYYDLLNEFFRGGPPVFDLILLGLGENGHTASLFPHAAVLGTRKK